MEFDNLDDCLDWVLIMRWSEMLLEELPTQGQFGDNLCKKISNLHFCTTKVTIKINMIKGLKIWYIVWTGYL